MAAAHRSVSEATCRRVVSVRHWLRLASTARRLVERRPKTDARRLFRTCGRRHQRGAHKRSADKHRRVGLPSKTAIRRAAEPRASDCTFCGTRLRLSSDGEAVAGAVAKANTVFRDRYARLRPINELRQPALLEISAQSGDLVIDRLERWVIFRQKLADSTCLRNLQLLDTPTR